MTIQEQLDLWGAENAGVPRLLTVKEAGRILALSRSSVYEVMAAGRLETVHVGRSVRIPADAISTYVRALRQHGETR